MNTERKHRLGLTLLAMCGVAAAVVLGLLSPPPIEGVVEALRAEPIAAQDHVAALALEEQVDESVPTKNDLPQAREAGVEQERLELRSR